MRVGQCYTGDTVRLTDYARIIDRLTGGQAAGRGALTTSSCLWNKRRVKEGTTPC